MGNSLSSIYHRPGIYLKLHEKGWGKSDENRCGCEKKEKKTEAEVDHGVNVDLRKMGLSMKEMQNRALWRLTGQKHPPRSEKRFGGRSCK